MFPMYSICDQIIPRLNKRFFSQFLQRETADVNEISCAYPKLLSIIHMSLNIYEHIKLNISLMYMLIYLSKYSICLT